MIRAGWMRHLRTAAHTGKGKVVGRIVGVVLRKTTGSGERRQFGHEGALDISRFELRYGLDLVRRALGILQVCVRACTIPV